MAVATGQRRAQARSPETRAQAETVDDLVRPFGRVNLFFASVVAVMVAHEAEHVGQMIQKQVLGNTCPTECRGLLGSIFDHELVHGIYNHAILLLLIGVFLVYRMWEPRWRRASLRSWAVLTVGVFAVQGYHLVEHTLKLDQVFRGHPAPTPGLVGQLLPRARGHNFSLVELHFTYSTIVLACVLVGFLGFGVHRHLRGEAPGGGLRRLAVAGAVFLVGMPAGFLGVTALSEDKRTGRTSGPFSAISQALAAPDTPTKAAPRWEHVATFSGTGPATKAFSIGRGAIQWRARWRCESGDFALTLVPPPRDGRALARSACPREGQGIATQTGRLGLAVASSGPWRVTIEQQVDTPLREPPLRGMGARSLVARGSFHPIDEAGSGKASLYRLPSGRLALRVENLATVPVLPELQIWLSRAANPKSTREAARAPYAFAGRLKTTMGDHNYVLPASTRAQDVRSIVLWCEVIQNAFTAAPLRPR
ncbi:MAG: DM13 domain-containing protein [Actinomycetota bacterium]|nr:DM13 domain-containing protein [Actinomycetota bacterium]